MTVRITWKRVLVTILTLALAGLLFAWSGLFQISASSGHWKITEWFLHWTMQNSVRTYSTFGTPDKVREDDGLVSAAGHFRQACQVCHGAPGQPPSPQMQAATPPAPDLAETVHHYDDAELFWIVQHGVKYTGMPAWPTQERPDEIRRMVGFLRRLPGMTPRQYEALTHVSARQAPSQLRAGLLESCTGCHGADGLGRKQGDIPILAGQKASYLRDALRDYASGKRASGPMQVAAAPLSESEMAALAEHFATMPGLEDKPLPHTDPILFEGIRERQLPACTRCHAPGKPKPLIAGQHATYLENRLRSWRGEETVIDAHKTQLPMPVIARRIPEKEIRGLARALSEAGGEQPANARPQP
ncbi:c-type cytochrome [Novosphingobium malaysiense]|uniref:Cytochrome C n=1 Tax=Novosphingobium malaysiense TaxID=1348853 RepID=A0A0B1ZPM8_9SPHN|nr:c-type cytochrome [Novosphingobium malaysiense]KHK91107.1 cytochrome C [Novosphingobium malaysiense]